jgi:hypothetical protein
MGNSSSSVISDSIYNASLANQFSGVCNVQCNASVSDTDISLVNSVVQGDIDITASCTANNQCLMNTTQTATSDVLMATHNAALATPGSAAAALFGLPSLSSQNTYNYDLQSTQVAINNSVNDQCNTTSTSTVDGTNIFATNSTIGGNIVIAASGDANGTCQLNTNMNAASFATMTQDNCSAAGKGAKFQCGLGKGSFSLTTLLVIGGVVVLGIIAAIIISRMMTKGTSCAVDKDCLSLGANYVCSNRLCISGPPTGGVTTKPLAT